MIILLLLLRIIRIVIFKEKKKLKVKVKKKINKLIIRRIKPHLVYCIYEVFPSMF